MGIGVCFHMTSVITSLQDELGEEGFLSYYRSILIPELERLANSGQISDFDRVGTQLVVHDLKTFNPQVRFLPLDTLSTQHGGYVGFAEGNLVDGTVLKHVLKKTHLLDEEREAYDVVQAAIQNSSLEHMLPHYHLAIPQKNMLVTAFGEGDVAYNILGKDDVDKKKILTQILDERKELIDHLKHKGVEFKQRLGSLTPTMKVFSPEEEFLDVYAQEVGNFLDAYRTENIHGDFNARNIIINGKTKWVDLSHAIGDGCPEMDVNRLIRKLDLTPEEKDFVVNYVANQYDGDASRERFSKVEITSNLVSAGKHMNSSAGNLLFTRAINSIDDAINQGGVSPKFKEVILTQSFGRELLDSKTYAQQIKKLQPTPVLSAEDESLHDRTKLSIEDTIQLLHGKVDDRYEGIKKKKRNQVRNVVFAGLAALATMASVYFGSAALESKRVEKKFMEMSLDEFSWQLDDHHVREYVRMAREANKHADKEVDGYNGGSILHLKASKFTRDNPLVKKTAEQYGIPSHYVYQIFKANQLMFDVMVDFKEEEGSQLFAPWLYYEKLEEGTIRDERPSAGAGPINLAWASYQGKENFLEGMDYLAKFHEHHKGDMKKTIMSFYNPVNYEIFTKEGLVDSTDIYDLCDVKFGGVRRMLREATHTVLHGAGSDMGGRLQYNWLPAGTDVPTYCDAPYDFILND
jgi:tRNA A-37 threonylcarbamoyl transferase component Bud32